MLCSKDAVLTLAVLVLTLQTIMYPAKGEEIVCPSGWNLFEPTACCYNLVEQDSVGYSAARDACLEDGAYLASVHSEEENQFILSKARDVTTKHIWLGGKANRDLGRKWFWDDESEWNYTNWSPGEPSDWNNIEEHLQLELSNSFGNSRTGKWNDAPGESYLYHLGGYACKKCPTPSSEFCPAGWLDLDRSCYLTSNARVTADTAEQNCSDAGGHLVSINSDLEQDFLARRAAAMIGDDYSMTMTRLSISCQTNWTLFEGCCYTTKDGSGVTYNRATEICNDAGGNLVSIHSEAENNFIFNLARTSAPTAGRAIIGYKINSYLHNATQNIPDVLASFKVDHHSQWEPEDGTANDFNNWDPAVKNTRLSAIQITRYSSGDYSDDLAPTSMRLDPGTSASDATVQSLQKTWTILGPRPAKEVVVCESCSATTPAVVDMNGHVWTGGKENPVGTGLASKWKWTDDSDFDYKNWAPEQPPAPVGTDLTPRCIAFSKPDNYKWNAVDCEKSKAKFICERPKEYTHYNAVRKQLLKQLEEHMYELDPLSKSVNISILTITHISEINEHDASVTLSGFYYQESLDRNLKWNADTGKFKDIKMLRLDEYLATPQLYFPTNTFGEEMSQNPYSFVTIRNTGHIRQHVPFRIRIICKYSSLNIPFDSMECTIPFGPPPGSDPAHDLRLTAVKNFGSQVAGSVINGWQFGNLRGKLHDVVAKPGSSGDYKASTPIDININDGYLVLKFTLKRIYQYYGLMVGSLLFAMTLILSAPWVADFSTAAVLLLFSLLTAGVYLHGLLASLPHTLDTIPNFVILYALTILSVIVVFIALMLIEKRTNLVNKGMKHHKIVNSLTSPLCVFPTNGSKIDKASPAEEENSSSVEANNLLIKRLIFCGFTIYFAVALIWFCCV